MRSYSCVEMIVSFLVFAFSGTTVRTACYKKRGKALLVTVGKAVGAWQLLADKPNTEVDYVGSCLSAEVQ